ncbi:MAG: glycosyltransferase family 4 protein [Gemmatales bacterium]|nr:glycosyltransferase family 4 protein [Gemmatales bacterium]MDW8387860.1 glycosyltransferase family 4 protein [Gemmatales bacterium]
MHILGLVEHPEHVCCRYRLTALQPFLEAEGHRLDVQAIPKSSLSRLPLWLSLRRYDVVVLQRRLLSSLHLLLVRRYARRLIFDYDDAVFLRDSYSGQPLESTIRRRRFAAVVHAADAVTAGNDFLAAEAVRYTNPERIHAVPTCVDPQKYPLSAHHPGGHGVTLVWIGSSSTLQGLERQRELLERVGSAVPGLRLKLICDRFLHLEQLPVVTCPWSQATEAAELAAADIAISWLPDDDWSRGKCGLKVLQYFAAGLPVVANRVGMHLELVRHGETGYLADTPAQWVEAIRRLAGDPVLRRRLGQHGRRLVEQRFSVRCAANKWLELLGGLANRSAA